MQSGLNPAVAIVPVVIVGAADLALRVDLVALLAVASAVALPAVVLGVALPAVVLGVGLPAVVLEVAFRQWTCCGGLIATTIT
jgi:hypothetical protein